MSVSFLVPIHDSGKSSAAADYELFSVEEKYFWNTQLSFIFNEQKNWLESMMKSATPSVVHYNVSGPNSRINVNSSDASTNVVTTNATELFEQLRGVLAQVPAESRGALSQAIDGMEQAAGRPGFVGSIPFRVERGIRIRRLTRRRDEPAGA